MYFREEAESGDSEMKDSYSDSSSDESGSTDKLWRWDGGSSEEGGFEQDGMWPMNDRLGYLYFQYFEKSTPYGRLPLMDKVPFYIHFFLPFISNIGYFIKLKERYYNLIYSKFNRT